MDRSWHHLWDKRRIPSEKGKVNYLTIQVQFIFIGTFLFNTLLQHLTRRAGWRRGAPKGVLVSMWTAQVTILEMKNCYYHHLYQHYCLYNHLPFNIFFVLTKYLHISKKKSCKFCSRKSQDQEWVQHRRSLPGTWSRSFGLENLRFRSGRKQPWCMSAGKR